MSIEKKIRFYFEVYVVQKLAGLIIFFSKRVASDRADRIFIKAFNMYLNSVDRVFNEILEF